MIKLVDITHFTFEEKAAIVRGAIHMILDELEKHNFNPSSMDGDGFNTTILDNRFKTTWTTNQDAFFISVSLITVPETLIDGTSLVIGCPGHTLPIREGFTLPEDHLHTIEIAMAILLEFHMKCEGLEAHDDLPNSTIH